MKDCAEQLIGTATSSASKMPPIACCRSCGGTLLHDILDLGSTPLANALAAGKADAHNETRYPLKLVWCPGCTLLQITENVPAETLFSHYLYRSSFSDAFLRHCEALAQRMTEEYGLNGQRLVVDIASNDGYLLQFYQRKGVAVLGVEPASNIAEVAEERGVPTRRAFFTNTEAQMMADSGLRADVIHAHNVLPHVADQRDFVAGIATLLKPDGIAVIEFAYAIDTIDKTEFDQIYHEHMCYFSLTALRHLCAQAGLAVTRVERLTVHGGSLRVFLAHAANAHPDETVEEMLAKEDAWGVRTPKPYLAFAQRTATVKTDLMALLREMKAEKKRIVAYGASAKGNTLMHYCGIDDSLIDYIVDRSTMKQGKYTPGTGLRIEPVEKLLEDQPDYALLLTWNFAEEILEQQKEYRKLGGQFIIPVPEVRVA